MKDAMVQRVIGAISLGTHSPQETYEPRSLLTLVHALR
jgi:hypothetical protein